MPNKGDKQNGKSHGTKRKTNSKEETKQSKLQKVNRPRNDQLLKEPGENLNSGNNSNKELVKDKGPRQQILLKNNNAIPSGCIDSESGDRSRSRERLNGQKGQKAQTRSQSGHRNRCKQTKLSDPNTIQDTLNQSDQTLNDLDYEDCQLGHDDVVVNVDNVALHAEDEDEFYESDVGSIADEESAMDHNQQPSGSHDDGNPDDMEQDKDDEVSFDTPLTLT